MEIHAFSKVSVIGTRILAKQLTSALFSQFLGSFYVNNRLQIKLFAYRRLWFGHNPTNWLPSILNSLVIGLSPFRLLLVSTPHAFFYLMFKGFVFSLSSPSGSPFAPCPTKVSSISGLTSFIFLKLKSAHSHFERSLTKVLRK